jgi:hypothetical protein
LDQPSVTTKTDKNAKADIKPGSPMESELVRLILLPPGDEDIMPPGSREPLTSDEIVNVVRWIQQGAMFPTKLPASK